MLFFNFGKPNVRKLAENKDVDRLIKAIRHSEKAIRQNAVAALGDIGDVRSVAPLIFLLQKMDYIRCYFPSVTATNAALGEITADIESVIDIIERLAFAPRLRSGFASDPDFNPIFPIITYREWNTIREIAAVALGKIGDSRAVDPLIVMLKDPTRGRTTSCGHLKRIDNPQMVELLITAIQQSECQVRTAAAEALGRIGDSQAVALLGAACSDPNLTVCRAAAKALGAIGDPKAVPTLLAALHAADFQLREAAAAALGEIGDDRAVEPLITAFQDAELHVYEAAGTALAKIGNKAVEPLIMALGHPDKYVRLAADQTLGKIGDKRAMVPLSTLLADPMEPCTQHCWQSPDTTERYLPKPYPYHKQA